MIFVDTGAWFAAFVPNDPDFAAADAWLAQNQEPLLTTDYVLDELLTLFKVRRELQRGLAVGEKILAGTIARLEWVSPEDVQNAWEVFRKFQDKGWSFTDCISRAVIERLNIQRAFSFDEHFRQFGVVSVVPGA
jgi:predicted nucleic acid-binding protein